MSPFQKFRNDCEHYVPHKVVEGGGGQGQRMSHGCNCEHKEDDECHALGCPLPWHIRSMRDNYSLKF